MVTATAGAALGLSYWVLWCGCQSPPLEILAAAVKHILEGFYAGIIDLRLENQSAGERPNPRPRDFEFKNPRFRHTMARDSGAARAHPVARPLSRARGPCFVRSCRCLCNPERMEGSASHETQPLSGIDRVAADLRADGIVVSITAPASSDLPPDFSATARK